MRLVSARWFPTCRYVVTYHAVGKRFVVKSPTTTANTMSSEPLTAERKRMRPEVRRNAVLDAALRVFAEAGFRRASLTEVGEEAGVTKGCVYHYFDSKEELLLALMRERSQSAASACLADAKSATGDEALAMMVKSLWRKYERDGQLELTTVALTELPHAPAVARVLFDEVATPNRAFLRDVLNRMNRSSPEARDGNANEKPSGAINETMDSTTEVAALNTQTPETDNELAAILVPFMVMGAALGYRMYRDIDPVKRSSQEIESALLRILQRGV